MTKQRISWWCVGLAAVAVAGCSGGGGSTGATRATVLLTDSPREDYAHVWATIYKVTLTPQDGSAAVTVFDNPSGALIDLRTLRDASGARYAFLSSADVPAGTYTGAVVTIAPKMQLIARGATAGADLAVDSAVPTDPAGNPVLSLTFKRAKTLGSGNTNVVIDFDLARFLVRSSGVLPVLGEGDGVGLRDHKRHEPGDHVGTISALAGTAPTLTFTLTTGNGQTVPVATTAATALFGATLADGATVRVEGTLDTTTGILVATSVGVCGVGGPPAGAGAPRAVGTASALDATAGTFTLTIARAGGFTVAGKTVLVATTASTVYRGDPGAKLSASDFFAALATTPKVAVVGAYDATTSTLTATELRIVDAGKHGGWERERHEFRGPGGLAAWGNGALKR